MKEDIPMFCKLATVVYEVCWYKNTGREVLVGSGGYIITPHINIRQVIISMYRTELGQAKVLSYCWV